MGKMNTIINDIRYAIRQLRKNPGFTVIAVLTLGLGIGATVTIFGAFNALVLDPFPYPNPEKIAYIWSNTDQPLSAPDFLDIHEQNTSFAEIGVYSPARLNLGINPPEPVYATRCTAGVLRTFEIPPVMGRWLDENDEKSGAEPVAVISHSLWTRVFGGNAEVVGNTIRLDEREVKVVGVMPEDFEFHSPWYTGHDCDIWVPLMLENRHRGNHWLLCVGRYKDGITLEQANTEIKAIGTRLAKDYPDSNLHKPFLVRSLWRQITRNTAPGSILLFGAVALLLLVACANVAGMLLARGTQRQEEFGVRLALGAARSDVIRLLLAEGFILALLGSITGVILSIWGLKGMQHLMPPLLAIGARRAAMQVNGTVLIFSFILAFITVLLFGLLPALTAARTCVVKTLNEAGRSQTGSRIRHRFLRHMVIAQIALSVVLANGAVLLSTSYLKVLEKNHNLDSNQILTAEITLQGQRYAEGQARQQFWDRFFERIQALPSVQHAAVTTKMPLEGGINFDVLVEGQVYDPTIIRPMVENSLITPDYFAAMGVPVLRGRPPESADARDELIGVTVNQTLAETFWPGENPIGKQIFGNATDPWFKARVVGVVGDIAQWGAEYPVMPELYFPYACRYEAGVTLVVRATGNARNLVPILREELGTIDREIPLANIRTMKDVVNTSVSGRRLYTQLINVFMGTALILTVVGIYGTLSYNIIQRNREIGVRIAVGALRHHILEFVFRQAALWVVAGLAIGLISTALLSFGLRSLVFNISPWNPYSLLVGLGLVAGSTLLACLVPAIRATRVDPMEALRYE